MCKFLFSKCTQSMNQKKIIEKLVVNESSYRMKLILDTTAIPFEGGEMSDFCLENSECYWKHWG